jgi:preprotein translocase subunit SecB
VSVDVDNEKPLSESNRVSLSLKVRSDGKRISATTVELTFDFTLIGDVGEPASRAVDISLRLNASYRIPAEVATEPSDIKAFARSNGMLNVWPYWREFVQSTTSRAGLPPLTVPLFRLHQKQPAKPSPTK